MKRVVLLTSLLVVGLFASQILPWILGEFPHWFTTLRQFVTMSLLAFIMIEVGRELDVDLKDKKQYAVDYGVAAAALLFLSWKFYRKISLPGSWQWVLLYSVLLPAFYWVAYSSLDPVNMSQRQGKTCREWVPRKRRGWLFHVLAVTVLSNIGKMFAPFCDRKEIT